MSWIASAALGDPPGPVRPIGVVVTGSAVSDRGAGANGSDASVLRRSGGLDSLGFECRVGTRIANSFLVTDPAGVYVDSLRVYAYGPMTNGGSAVTVASVRIWRGGPPGIGTHVFGDPLENGLISKRFIGAYRVDEADLADTTRPIYEFTIQGRVILAADQYWMDVALYTPEREPVYFPPITVEGEVVTGYAQGYAGGSWSPYLSGGFSQGIPVVVMGVPMTGEDWNGDGLPDDVDILLGAHPDCNDNGWIDARDIAEGISADANGDGVPDECQSPPPPRPCAVDWNQDGVVDSRDFFLFLADFFDERADFNRDGVVDSRDVFNFVSLFFLGC